MASEIQSVIFDRSKWTLKKAKVWLKSKGYKRRFRQTEDFYRFRQTDPSRYKRFITKKEGNGIKLIIGFT